MDHHIKLLIGTIERQSYQIADVRFWTLDYVRMCWKYVSNPAIFTPTSTTHLSMNSSFVVFECELALSVFERKVEEDNLLVGDTFPIN